MKLHEYQSKQLFAQHGIPIPKGRMAMTAAEAKAIAEELHGRVVVKSQVLVGGRGKAGGIRLANSPEEAEEIATQILAMQIKGLPVRKVLVDEAANIQSEIYLGVTNDRAARRPVMIASAEGGIEIEEVARTNPIQDRPDSHRPAAGTARVSGARPGGVDRAAARALAVLHRHRARAVPGVLRLRRDAGGDQPAGRSPRRRRCSPWTARW